MRIDSGTELSRFTILFISLRADIGGGPEHLYQLLAYLSDSIRPLVACPDDKPYRARYSELIGMDNVIDVPHRVFSMAALRALAREIRRCRVDLIHSHGKGAGLYGRLLSTITGRPCVHTFHGLHVGEYGMVKRHLYFALERVLGLASTVAICVSEGERDKIAKAYLLPRSKLHLIENGVEIPPLRASEPYGAMLRIVAVNRYDYSKNPELILDIASVLIADPDMGPFKLTVFGEGERLAACQNTVQMRELTDYIQLAGPTFEPRARFREAHVFLSTSRSEGMPLAVLEAMSEGLPVVATDVVGNRDVIEHGVSGLLFNTEDAMAGARAIKELQDAPRRVSIGRFARERVEARYSIQRMAERTVLLYHEILETFTKRSFLPNSNVKLKL